MVTTLAFTSTTKVKRKGILKRDTKYQHSKAPRLNETEHENQGSSTFQSTYAPTRSSRITTSSDGTVLKTVLQTLQNKQHRLLLLLHAAQCPHGEDGRCHVTPHCSEMKKLWKHINEKHKAECKSKCQFPHCRRHYQKCKDVGCEVCSPVSRNFTNKRSHEKEKKIAKMAQQLTQYDRQDESGRGDNKEQKNYKKVQPTSEKDDDTSSSREATEQHV